MDYKDIKIKEIEYEKRLLKQYEIKLKRLPSGKLVCLRKKEKAEYYYIDAKDMVERARDYEKKADEVEAMEKTLENLEETATQMSPDEFKDAFGLVEVVDKPEDSTG